MATKTVVWRDTYAQATIVSHYQATHSRKENNSVAPSLYLKVVN